MKTGQLPLLGLVFLLAVACSGHQESSRKSFLIGFTPFPYSTTSIDQVLAYTYDKIGTDASMISHHFDDGVPWNEALGNLEYTSSILYDWNYRKSHTPAGHKVCVAVIPISIGRDGLAPFITIAEQTNL